MRVYLWTTGIQILVLSHPEMSGFTTVAFAHDGSRIVSGSWDGRVPVWDVYSGDQVQCFEGHNTWVNCVAMSPDSSRVASGGGGMFGEDCTVRQWDLRNGKEQVVFRGHQGCVTSVAFSPDGQRIASIAPGSWPSGKDFGDYALHCGKPPATSRQGRYGATRIWSQV